MLKAILQVLAETDNDESATSCASATVQLGLCLNHKASLCPRLDVLSGGEE